MMPPRTFAACGAVCCAVLLAVACSAGHAVAQTTSYSNLGWGDRHVSGANPFRGSTTDEWTTSQQGVSAATQQQGQWQAAGAGQSGAQNVATQRGSVPQPATKSSRWLLPNHQSTASTSDEIANRPSTSRAGSALTTSETSQPAAGEPRQFAPPSDATQLTSTNEATDAPPVRSSRRSRSSVDATAKATRTVAVPAATIPARRVAPATGHAASQRPAAAASRPQQLGRELHRAVDKWIKPVGFQMDGYVEGEYIEGDYMGGPTGPGSCNTCDAGYPTCGDACGGPVCGGGVGCGCGADCGCGPDFGCGPGYCDPGCGCEPTCGAPCERPWVLGFGAGDPEALHDVCVRVPKMQELMIDLGVHGFKGPYDRTRDGGNFGFHEGFNAGFKVPYTEFGYQLGYRATQSQLNGDKNTNATDPFTQQFVTAGLFRRARCGNGWQGGAVWDMLRDERWGAVDFHQVRAEVSYLSCGRHELGFWAAVHASDHEMLNSPNDLATTIYQPTDQYLLFYRFHGKCGGEGRFYGGLSDDSDGIVGADMLLPLQDRWSLRTSFAYLIPDENGGTVGASQEAWNLSIGLVWHWNFRARSCHSNCYRPLFDVADNGWMIIDDRPGTPVTGGGD